MDSPFRAAAAIGALSRSSSRRWRRAETAGATDENISIFIELQAHSGHAPRPLHNALASAARSASPPQPPRRTLKILAFCPALHARRPTSSHASAAPSKRTDGARSPLFLLISSA